MKIDLCSLDVLFSILWFALSIWGFVHHDMNMGREALAIGLIYRVLTKLEKPPA